MHEGTDTRPSKPRFGKDAGPCSHCGANDTPQWREGPPQKLVLCNACGLWYKRHGHLGEYRPGMRRRVTLVKPVPARGGFFMTSDPTTDKSCSRRKRCKPTCTC